MATSNISYQSIATAIAVTSADSLGDGAWCSSALVDNQTNLYMDALIGGSLKTGTVPAGGGTIDIYIGASWDGVDFTGGVTAGDGVITWGTTGDTHVAGENDLFFVASISVDATDDDTDVHFGPFSVAQACGGVMPLEWCVVIENNTGAAFNDDAPEAVNHLEYTGIEFTSA